MGNKDYQKNKESFEKKHVKGNKISLKEKKTKGNVSKSYLSIEEIIIQHIKSNY